jgi:hypothetical protein
MHEKHRPPVAPRDDDNPSTRCTHPHQLPYEFGLGRHVFAALQTPHQVELVVLKGLLQCVRNLEAAQICHSCALGEIVASLCLPPANIYFDTAAAPSNQAVKHIQIDVYSNLSLFVSPPTYRKDCALLEDTSEEAEVFVSRHMHT